MTDPGLSLFGTPLVAPTIAAGLVSADDFAQCFSLGDGTAASLSQLEQSRVQTAIEIASDLVRTNRRLLSLVTGEQVTVDGSGSANLVLPQERLPVVGVSQIAQLQDTSYVVVDAALYDWSAAGIVTLRSDVVGWPASWPWRVWTRRPRGVQVTYSHGYAELPRAVAGIVLNAAKRFYDSQGWAVQTTRLGDYSVTFEPGGGGVGLLAGEEVILKQYEVYGS